jgi:hypothetical protein
MTVRLALSVEGRTEKEFVDNVLSSHLQQYFVYVEARTVRTKEVVDGPNHTGGAVNLDRVIREVRSLLPNFDRKRSASPPSPQPHQPR